MTTLPLYRRLVSVQHVSYQKTTCPQQGGRNLSKFLPPFERNFHNWDVWWLTLHSASMEGREERVCRTRERNHLPAVVSFDRCLYLLCWNLIGDVIDAQHSCQLSQCNFSSLNKSLISEVVSLLALYISRPELRAQLIPLQHSLHLFTCN